MYNVLKQLLWKQSNTKQKFFLDNYSGNKRGAVHARNQFMQKEDFVRLQEGDEGAVHAKNKNL